MDQDLITRIVEAALLGSSHPLSVKQLGELFPEESQAPPGSIELALETLAEGNARRGVELVEVASGFRFQVRAEVYPWVARLWTERQTRYGRAVLETLALIAYRQPITRGEIEQIRGVAVSTQVIKTLEERDWVRVVGHRDVPGKPALFGTTRGFLDYFGLKSLDQLPPLADLKDIPELEPELPFDTAPRAASAAGPEAANDDTPADAGNVVALHPQGAEVDDADASQVDAGSAEPKEEHPEPATDTEVAHSDPTPDTGEEPHEHDTPAATADTQDFVAPQTDAVETTPVALPTDTAEPVDDDDATPEQKTS